MDRGQPVAAEGAFDDRLSLFRRETYHVPEVEVFGAAARPVVAPLPHLGVLRDRAEGEFVGDPVGAPKPPLDPHAPIAQLVEVAAPDGAGVGMVVAPQDVGPESERVHSLWPLPRHAMHGSVFAPARL